MRQEEKIYLHSGGEGNHEDKAFFGKVPPQPPTNTAQLHFKSTPRGNNRPGPYALRNNNRFGDKNNRSGFCSNCQIFCHSEENCLHKKLAISAKSLATRKTTAIKSNATHL
jgi:hypothetical protein